MNARQTNSRPWARGLLLLGGVAATAALSCGRDVLVGNAKSSPFPQLTGGTSGTGGSVEIDAGDPCAVGSGGANGDGGIVAAGGTTFVGTGGGTGKGPMAVSCPTISIIPGTLNACGRTTSVAFSPDGQYVATATQTPRPNIHVWRLSDGVLLEDLDGHGSAQNIGSYSVAFSPDGTTLATAGNANVPPGCAVGSTTNDPTEVKLWDVATGALLPNLPTTTGSYADAAQFSHDGKRLVTASGKIGIWNVADGTLIATIPIFAYNARFSPDDSRIIATGLSNHGGVYSATDGTTIFAIPGLGEDVNDGAYSPDGSEIVTTGAGGTLQFFDTNGNLLQSFVAHTVNYTSHAVWVDNDHVVSEDWGGNVKSWSRIANHFVASGSWSLGSQAMGLAVSPDGKTLAVGGDGGFMFITYLPSDPTGIP